MLWLLDLRIDGQVRCNRLFTSPNPCRFRSCCGRNLVVFAHTPLQVRERLIVAYYRYKNMGNDNFMEVKNLCGGTGYKIPGPGDKNREPVRFCYIMNFFIVVGPFPRAGIQMRCF